MSIFRLGSLAAAIALTVLVGHVVDRTTGQSLAGVRVTGSTAHGRFAATTNDRGLFHVHLPPGTYTLHLSSSDVPPQEHQVTVKGKRQALTLQACSTTLDYSCGTGGPGGA